MRPQQTLPQRTPPRPALHQPTLPRDDAAGSLAGQPKLRLLTFSTLFPNAAQPNHGVFVANRLEHLLASGEVSATVLAPVPWFPGRTPPLARVPAREVRGGVTVWHPRFLAVPAAGMVSNPLALYRAARQAVRRMGGAFDLIDAHYLYPDGVAAAWLGRALGLPVVLTARGSDAAEWSHRWYPGRLIRGAIRQAAALIAVSEGLRQTLVGLGAPPDKVVTLRNGVDLKAFQPPADRAALRHALGLDGRTTLLSVGRLVPLKGYHEVIAALPALPGFQLMIAGDGPERGALAALAARLGVADRVRLLGAVAHARLPDLYGAADALVLASAREGWPNVVLEAMACGTPVVAPPVFGIAEMLAAPEAGLVIGEATAAAIAEGVGRFLATPPDRAAIRAIAERFSWDETSQGQLALFRRVLAGARPPC